MKQLLMCALFLISPLAQAATEAEALKVTLLREGNPVPPELADQLPQIEQELTPSTREIRSELISSKSLGLCHQTRIKLYYKMSDDLPVESFEALYTTPQLDFLVDHLHLQYPGIVIQPTLAGPSLVESTISLSLCLNGMASIMPTETLTKIPAKLPDLEVYDRNTREEMIRARRMVDYLYARPAINKSHIGAIGFSRGAIAGALLIGIEPRIRFAFLGAGGVGVGHIIANSQTQQGLADNMKQMRASGFNFAQYEAALRSTLRYDGILFAHRFDPAHLKLMIVHNDDLVDVNNQELLRRVFGNPEVVYRDDGHVNSILDIVIKEVGHSEYIRFFKAQVQTLN